MQVAMIITYLFFGLGFLFLLLSLLFRKRGKWKWIFGIAAIFSFLFSFVFMYSGQFDQYYMNKKLNGSFYNEQTNTRIYLNEDQTWSSDAGLFKCGKGEWSYYSNEDVRYIEFKGECDHGFDRLGIPASDIDALKFDASLTVEFAGNTLVYLRIEE
jgi:amino acid transporter